MSVIQESGDERKPKELAKTMVVIVRGALNNIVFPYAVFAGKSLKGHNLFPLFWEAMNVLDGTNFEFLQPHAMVHLATKNCFRCTILKKS